MAKDVLQDGARTFPSDKIWSDVRIINQGFGTRSNPGVKGIRILQDGIPESEPDGEQQLRN